MWTRCFKACLVLVDKGRHSHEWAIHKTMVTGKGGGESPRLYLRSEGFQAPKRWLFLARHFSGGRVRG